METELKPVAPQCQLCRQADCYDVASKYCSRCLAVYTSSGAESVPGQGLNAKSYIKATVTGLAMIVVFIIILADAELGMATILYAITNNNGWIFLPWLGLVLLTVQFVRVAELHRAARKIKESPRWTAVKLISAAAIGTGLGILIWPAFDHTFGLLIGIAFGSLLGLTIELTIEIVMLTRPA